MEVVISDTNILIDLFSSGLLNHCNNLNLDFRTIDLVLSEVKSVEQLTAINNIIDHGILKVDSLDSRQLGLAAKMIGLYQPACNLSAVDVAVIVYAKEHHCRLLTGDKKMREKAKSENVVVSGILYLIDRLIEGKSMSNGEMVASLLSLMKSNARLPQKLILQRIESLSDDDNE